MGGKLAIASEVGKGTTVSITLPRSAPAAWFATEITLPSRGKVFVIDDDTSMDPLWINRLRHALTFEALEVKVFTLVSAFVEAVRQCSDAYRCLVDVELRPGDFLDPGRLA